MLIILGFISFIIGFFLVVFMSYLVRKNIIREAKQEANELVSTAQSISDELVTEKQREFDEFKHELEVKSEKELSDYSENISTLKSTIEDVQAEHNSKLQLIHTSINKKKQRYDREQSFLKSEKEKLDTIRKNYKAKQSSYVEALKKAVGDESVEIKNQLKTKIEEDTKTNAVKLAQEFEEETERNSERTAREILDIALNRFARPYCPERGIQYVNLKNEATRNKVFGPDKLHLQLIEKECGVDLIHNEEMNSVSVSGFDPARRELARATLEHLLTEKHIDEKAISNVILKTKKVLFKKIKTDGTKLFKNLKLSNVDPNIINMMGALRYRYSYAQNQYFHCSEVGYLCGLLSSELDLNIYNGRRAGVLHDLGKAMDHSIDGGHAVIGADFIEKNGETEEIVHAVRAHHYDVQPSTPLCYLVIAADALSGARPGARRSTADAYMQKMGQLEEIGNSFKEVIDTFIMSAGREVRVQVDSRKVDDLKAVALSKQVAKKIEEQCTYPGLIKVTVVRKTQAFETAK